MLEGSWSEEAWDTRPKPPTERGETVGLGGGDGEAAEDVIISGYFQ